MGLGSKDYAYFAIKTGEGYEVWSSACVRVVDTLTQRHNHIG